MVDYKTFKFHFSSFSQKKIETSEIIKKHEKQVIINGTIEHSILSIHG